MKRTPALQRLSRDHHEGLAVAQRLRRTSVDTAPEATVAFLDYWRNHGRHHFRSEEEILLPAFARYGDPHHPLVVRVLLDHLTIRGRALELDENLDQPLQALQELGLQLADHIRLEERQLFPLIENTLPAGPLARVAAALDQAEHEGE